MRNSFHPRSLLAGLVAATGMVAFYAAVVWGASGSPPASSGSHVHACSAEAMSDG